MQMKMGRVSLELEDLGGGGSDDMKHLKELECST